MNLPANINAWKLLVKQHQKIILVVTSSVLIVVVFGLLSSPKITTVTQTIEKTEKPKFTGVKESVDPRAIWVDTLTDELNKLNKKIDETSKKQSKQYKKTVQALKVQISALKQSKESEANKKSPVKAQMADDAISRIDENSKKEPENYVISGSFARAVLLTGVVAETGTDAASTPQPILLRLVDHGIFSKGYKTEQIKEAILIGACHGNISSERALCRLQSLSLMNDKNEVVERPVEGWVIGEDGRPGVKGDVIDKASDVARMAMLNGILGGMASFFQSQATTGVYPISPFTGQQNALTGMNSVKAASASGAGNALQKLADYAIKRAEQMSPVIVVGAGRVVDVVFKNGFHLKNESTNNNSLQPVTGVSATNHPVQSPQYQTTNSNMGTRTQGYNEGMKSLENLQVEQGGF